MGVSMWSALWLVTFVQLAFGFTAKDSTEAKLRFSYFVEFHSDTRPTEAASRDVIDDQLTYLFGTMAADEKYAVPRGEHRTKITSIHRKVETKGEARVVKGVWVADYDYDGWIQVKKGPRTRYTVVLPRDPSQKTIYDPGLDKAEKNLCTDEHYNSYGDYWYFWNPDQSGCPLVEGEHFDRIRGTIDRIANTRKSYPEYTRLVYGSQDAKEILLYAFFGMDDPSLGKDPTSSPDINAVTYRKVRRGLVNMGFDGKRGPQMMPPEEIQRILRGKKYRYPYVEVLNKRTPKADLRIVLFFGPTGIDQTSGAFHYFYKEANETAAVMIYDGHSGLGGHLDLKAIENLHNFSLRQSSKRYQLFFFNSCTSYSYYNTVYFYRKAPRSVRLRTKSLDIMTNGLSTLFKGMDRVNLALIGAVDRWANEKNVESYQELADAMDADNLFGVNGDEDNPTTAQEVELNGKH